jgi:DNA repair exonuclease SbcCD ATPase subunit
MSMWIDQCKQHSCHVDIVDITIDCCQIECWRHCCVEQRQSSSRSRIENCQGSIDSRYCRRNYYSNFFFRACQQNYQADIEKAKKEASDADSKLKSVEQELTTLKKASAEQAAKGGDADKQLKAAQDALKEAQDANVTASSRLFVVGECFSGCKNACVGETSSDACRRGEGVESRADRSRTRVHGSGAGGQREIGAGREGPRRCAKGQRRYQRCREGVAR